MPRMMLVGFLLLVNLFVSEARADAIGTVVASYGSPTATGPGGSRTLNSGTQVFEHDKITVSNGNAQIQLIDGTKLVVGTNSSLVLEKFLLQGGDTAQNVSVDALRGTFRFITGKSPKTAYNIQTANATIGIRGTGFDFWVADRTGLALLKGRVRLCGKKGNKSCIDLEPNCSVGVAGDPNPAHLLGGFEKSASISSRLPFLIDQSALRKSFRLDTKVCDHYLPQEPTHHDTQAPPPPPPPPPPPKVPSTNG